MITYRTPEEVKEKLDEMKSKCKSITIEHEVGAYTFDHYIYHQPAASNNFESDIYIYVWVDDRVERFIILKEKDMRKPTENDIYAELIDCYWDERYPNILSIDDKIVRNY